MLDGLSRLEPLVQRTKDLGMDSLAITDHGGLYGAIDFYRIAVDAGVKPIIGCEMYVAPGSRHARDPRDKTPFHLTVLAQNATGYHNLIKLVTKAHLEGFYYKPRVDREVLEEHSEGLVVLSGCPSGEVPSLIAQGRIEDARTAASWHRERFGGYYLELMEHGGVPELPAINKGLLELHKGLDIPLVATNDLHYVRREDAKLQDILICIHTNTNVNDQKRLIMEEDSYYLRSSQEMEALFTELPDAVSNTQLIAEGCEMKLDFSQLRLPEFKTPEGTSAQEFLEELCEEGLRRRIEHVTSTERERLAYELEVIRQTQYANYFLVVWDIAKFVRERNIFFAVRGSAAASLALYCLGVTDVNPLPYSLVFERFLNLERKEMPDIDMDFQDDRREEVLNYVVSKYGRAHVAQIITFGTLGARASIRDVGRAMAIPYADVDRVAKAVPFRLHITLDEAIAESEELKEIYADESYRELIDNARGLEGLTRHSSTHAAGVVISKDPLDDVVPLQKPIRGDDDSVNMTQFAMEPIAALGLLKLDFLGLTNLTILVKALELIVQTSGTEINLRDIPFDDAKTFALLSRGETVGVFQMEGSGMTRYIKELQPSSLGDVAAMIALYRPGPMEHIGAFIDAKHGRSRAKYPHPDLTEILEETYGVIVYQDQVLHIARTFAGYSLGQADVVRKAMGKKIPEIMAQEREGFISGAVAKGYTRDVADEIFALIEPFAGYAFNKAHSVSYGVISYWTAYLKANHTTEYMTALLNCYIGSTERVAGAVLECRRLKIPVLGPDINRGHAEFSIEATAEGTDAIRFGMAAVKNVSAAAVEQVLEAREREGPFESIEHMCRAADMSGLKRLPLESLIKAGAFDAFGDRGALLEVVERILGLAQSEANLRNSDQSSMFELLGESMSTPLVTIVLPDVVTPAQEKEAWERELLGMSLSGAQLLMKAINAEGSESIVFRSQIEPEMANKKVALVGQVSSASQRQTRDNKPFIIATVNLMDGPIDVFVWQELLEETRGLWQEGTLVTVVGTVRVRDDQISINCSAAAQYSPQEEATGGEDEAPEAVEANVAVVGSDAGGPPELHAAAALPTGPMPRSKGVATNGALAPRADDAPRSMRRLNLRIRETGQVEADQILLDDVKRILLEFRGDDEVSLEIATDGRIVTLEWPPVQVDACAELEQRLNDVLGEAGRISVETPE